jgi:phage terminase large subunit
MAQTKIKFCLTEKLLPFLNTHKRFKVAIGGRAGTKSQSCVDILIYLVATMGKRVCCFREFGSSIEDSIWTLIADEITQLGVQNFNIQTRKIAHKSGGFFKSKGLGRDSKSVKSFSGFDIFLVEEGDFLTEEILTDLTPTLRKADSELWIIFNPQYRTDATAKRFILPFYKTLLQHKVYTDDLHYIVWTNYDENPWFPETLKLEREFDEQHLSKVEYDHKWLGHFKEDLENAIIKAEWFDAAVKAYTTLGLKPKGIEVVGHDPSDMGPDSKGLCYRHGSFVLDAVSKETGDVNEGMDWALEYANQRKVDLFVWDCDGMGVSLNRQVEDSLKGKHTKFLMYKGSEAVDHPGQIYEGVHGETVKRKTNKESFYNKRAQKSWFVRDRFFNTWLAVEKNIWTDPGKMIFINPEIKELELLRAEACRIPRKHNNNGLIQLVPKPEMKTKFKIDSPNLFDSLVMSFEDGDLFNEQIELEFTSWQ